MILGATWHIGYVFIQIEDSEAGVAGAWLRWLSSTGMS